MVSPEQIQTILDQNAQLMAQNQQLITLLSSRTAPEIPASPKKKTKESKHDRNATQVTLWYLSIHKKLNPRMAENLKSIILHKRLWQG